MGLLDIPHLIEFAGLDIILFLIGMMILVGYLEENHFFDSLVNTLIRYIGPRPLLLLVTLMVVGAVSAALVDEVTSILFMTATMIHLTSRFGVNPIPFVIIQVFATNIGSSATVVGNPIGVMIAMRAGFTFQDFLRCASPISLCALVVTIPISLFYYSKGIREWKHKMKGWDSSKRETAPQRSGHQLFICLLLFIGTIAGLVLHARLEKWLGLQKTCSHRASLSCRRNQPSSGTGSSKGPCREKSGLVDTELLHDALCIGGTLKYVGTTSVIAKFLLSVCGGNPKVLFIVLTWTIGILTGFMDNVLAVATFIPIIQDIKQAGIDITPHWWQSFAQSVRKLDDDGGRNLSPGNY